MDREELGAWLRLLETPKVGRESARKLLLAFGSPQSVIQASSLARREVVGAGQSEALASPPEGLQGLIDKAMDWLFATTAPPRAVITLGDPRYPQQLLETADPPFCCTRKGDSNCFRQMPSPWSEAAIPHRRGRKTRMHCPPISAART